MGLCDNPAAKAYRDAAAAYSRADARLQDARFAGDAKWARAQTAVHAARDARRAALEALRRCSRAWTICFGRSGMARSRWIMTCRVSADTSRTTAGRCGHVWSWDAGLLPFGRCADGLKIIDRAERATPMERLRAATDARRAALRVREEAK